MMPSSLLHKEGQSSDRRRHTIARDQLLYNADMTLLQIEVCCALRRIEGPDLIKRRPFNAFALISKVPQKGFM